MPSTRQKRKADASTVNEEAPLEGRASNGRHEKPEKNLAPKKRAKQESVTVKEAVNNGAKEVAEETPRGIKYWLMKAEPESRIVKGKDVKFSIDDLENMKTSPWDGVRNHQAKNFMRAMKQGDKAFFYHSNCKIPGIAGIMEISKEAYPDYTAIDHSHPYYDEKSSQKDEPIWYMVDVKFFRKLKRLIPLKELQEYKEGELKDMTVVGKGRLSVQPVREKEWEFILTLEDKIIED